jgi:mono/diheme cytochrome c family protein
MKTIRCLGRHGFLPALALLACTNLAFAQGTKTLTAPETPVDFSRQILPILSDNCFACHGPDAGQRKARLRLDTRDGARAALRDGTLAIVPGKSADSVLIQRVASEDSSQRMPPPRTGKRLTPEQIDLLRRWINEGANWSLHWSFAPPRRAVVPHVRNTAWPREAIDYFILARLEAAKLHPSPEEGKARLLRRVTLDLTGLPPTPAELDAFLSDSSSDAYEKVVDQLLQSPHYGEHLARYWLDAARYGDTHGLHLDNYREMWPYRDWVIQAYNANLPFNEFIVKQLAGDLLPNATLADVVASGFNRCHVTTSEGGSIDEEVYVRNVDDRVDTTGIVFLGLTVGCSRCHDHKYDPIKMKDYYQLFGIFNSLDDKPLDGNAARVPPIIQVPRAEQAAALKGIDERLATIRKKIDAELAKLPLVEDSKELKETALPRRSEYVWIEDDIPAGARASADGSPDGHWTFVTGPQHPVYSGKRSSMRAATGLSQHFFDRAEPGLLVGAGDSLFAYVYLDAAKPPKEIMLQWNTGRWEHRAYWGEDRIDWGARGTPERLHRGPLPPSGKWVRLEVEAAKVGLKPGQVIKGWAFSQFGGTVFWDHAGIVTRTPQGKQTFDSFAIWLRLQESIAGATLPEPLREAFKQEPGKRRVEQNKQLHDYFLEHVSSKTRPIFEPLHRQLAQAEKERRALDEQIPATLVSHELSQPRPAYILKRGEYNHRGERVGRDTPGFLPPLPKSASHDRLGFARWLVSRDNPLTARVIVNRLWQHVFGTGIVKTAEDFGSQGEPPSHPELLDWLAVQFQDEGWNVKKMMKRFVMSASYRQSTRLTPDRLAKDPDNRLLSRGPRYRLDAEMLRDQALAVSGLLVQRVGGPSVKPPQPAGLWEAVGYTDSNTAHFTADRGCDKVHRRSLYTFWKRTSAPPQMNILDAPSREACTVRRERTDTPLQALLLMNEKQFVECARALAEKTMREAGPDPQARLTYLFRRATARSPDVRELAELLAEYRDHLATYQKDKNAARSLIAVGESKPDASLDPSELAAWTMVANLVLNLDEVLNKG